MFHAEKETSLSESDPAHSLSFSAAPFNGTFTRFGRTEGATGFSYILWHRRPLLFDPFAVEVEVLITITHPPVVRFVHEKILIESVGRGGMGGMSVTRL